MADPPVEVMEETVTTQLNNKTFKVSSVEKKTYDHNQLVVHARKIIIKHNSYKGEFCHH